MYVRVRLSVCMYVCMYAELELEIGRPFIKIRNIIMDYQMSFPLKMYSLTMGDIHNCEAIQVFHVMHDSRT